ncbi:DUF5683 domain-containing protein [Mangrovimonas sp. AS39]|uniref:DUF5683 domain-containing protein n=1 Tax=Mangrovimonas futianensis TaxID=2895523 RepID=UPI001E55F4C3|nr:DUF5683 domain-containing protein [Mangrovimonas futianensis]MCF1195808.1 DUF5683 domain-containing protein [Mangrovimonas futianensis]
MTSRLFIIIILFCFSVIPVCFSQENDEEKTEEQQNVRKSKSYIDTEDLVVEQAAMDKKPIDPLAPSKAAFYSAILPGLGQAYNKKYWKIPIVYAFIGGGLYFYFDNDREYDRYRDAYKSRLAGYTTDEFYGVVTDDGLVRAQKTLRRNKEISLLVTLGFYVLNIIEANVNAHLMQFNVDDALTVRPHYKINDLNNKGDVGLTLNFKF